MSEYSPAYSLRQCNNILKCQSARSRAITVNKPRTGARINILVNLSNWSTILISIVSIAGVVWFKLLTIRFDICLKIKNIRNTVM